MKKKTNYTRRRFIASSLATGFAVSLQLYSCTKSNASPDGKPDDGSIDDPNKGKLKISGVSLPTAIESNKGAELIILGRASLPTIKFFLNRSQMPARRNM